MSYVSAMPGPSAAAASNQITSAAMGTNGAHRLDAAGAGHGEPGPAQSGVLIISGLLLAGALFVLAVLSTGSAEPFVLAILAILAMIGVFFLFGLAADLIKIGEIGQDERLALAVTDGLEEAIQIAAADGSVVYVNQAFRGLAGADATGRPFSLEEIFAGEPAAGEALFRLSRAAERGQDHHEEFRVHGLPATHGLSTTGRRRTRQTRWIRIGVKALNDIDVDGQDQALTAWRIADITKDRAAGSEARRQQAMQAWMNGLPVGLMSVFADGRIEQVNLALAGWLGVAADEIHGAGLSLSDLAGGDAAPLLLDFINREDAGFEDGAGLDIDAVCKDGRTLALRFLRPAERAKAGAGTLSLVALKRGDTAGCEPVGQAKTLQLAQFFQSAPFGIATLDKSGRITSKNGAFGRMFPDGRASKARTINGLLSRKGDKQARDMLVNALNRAIAERGARNRGALPPVEITFGTKGEHARRIYVTPFGRGAAREAVILYVVDTTEQKALELKFAQSQKMEAVGQLAGGIAHDFNNVLTVIMGLSDLFLQTRRPTDAGYNDIMQIRQNSNRAAGMVRQLLAFSRKQTLTAEVLALNDVVQDLGYTLRRLLGERVELKMHCQRDLWLVKADQTQFEQVVINLAVNARDAMPNGGRLTIRTKNIRERDSLKLADLGIAPGEYVLVEAKDTGVGMAPDVLEKIFDPFYSTKDVGKGTGLGLSTVYGIVKQTGGYVFPESKPGKGTTFRVYLPRYQGKVDNDEIAQARSDKKERPRDLTGSGRVLLVEDEDAVRNFAARALQRQGYEVLEAASGVEALEVIDASDAPIDIVVSDVVMPEMDGPTLLKELRKSKPDLKFIFVSGYPDDAFQKCLDEGEQFAFLPKPFTLSQLAAKVKEQLEG